MTDKNNQDESKNKKACWNIKVINSPGDTETTANTVQTEYSKKPKCTCKIIDKTSPVENDCECCFRSKKWNEHAENELEVTEKRDIETIGQVENTARGLRILSSIS